MIKTNLKAGIGSDRGIGIEVFRLDAEVEGLIDLTAEEQEAVATVAPEEKTSTAVMRIYEEIGEGFFGEGMSLKKFSSELDGLGDVKNLNVHINSLGGDTFTAQAIYSILSDYPAKKTAYIDGVAASAATVIACAADEVVARENSNYMIHRPWMVAIGDSSTMRKAADDLDAVTEPVMNVYRSKVNGKVSDEKIIELMDDETWMTAETALENGFVDKVRGKIRAISRASKNQILCSGRLLDVSKYGYNNVPNYPKIRSKKDKEAVQEVVAAAVTTKGNKIMTKQDIDAALLTEIETEARTAERSRITALSAMNPRNDVRLEEIISKAREEGKHPTDIAIECLAIVQEQLAEAATINALAKDASKANGVSADDAPIAPSSLFNPVSPEQAAQSRFVSSLAAAVKTTSRRPTASIGRNNGAE